MVIVSVGARAVGRLIVTHEVEEILDFPFIIFLLTVKNAEQDQLAEVILLHGRLTVSGLPYRCLNLEELQSVEQHLQRLIAQPAELQNISDRFLVNDLHLNFLTFLSLDVLNVLVDVHHFLQWVLNLA